MNGFRYLTESLKTKIDLRSGLYALLISSISPRVDDEEEVYSSFTYSRLEHLPLPLDEILDQLSEEGFIEELTDEEGEVWFMIGKWAGKKPTFLPDLVNADISEEIQTLKDLIKSAVKSSKKNASLYRGFTEKMSAFLSGKIPSNASGFVDLFVSVSQLFFLESPRSPMQKEYGQMKTLTTLYSGDQLVRMIFYYILNSDKYGTSFPSIGGLLYNKDKIYSKLRKTTIKNEETDLRYE